MRYSGTPSVPLSLCPCGEKAWQMWEKEKRFIKEGGYTCKKYSLSSDLPDIIHCEQCVRVEEGIVRDVVAAHVEQPYKLKKIITTPHCLQQKQLAH